MPLLTFFNFEFRVKNTKHSHLQVKQHKMKTKHLLTLTLGLLLASSTAFAQYGTGLFYDGKAAKEFSYKKPGKGYAGELPSSFSLKAHTPYAKNQGNYGTCTSWAVAYSAMSTAYAYNMGITNRNIITGIAFCPYFVYNQVKADASCSSGSSIPLSILLLMETGAKRFYSPVIGCGALISDDMINDAGNFRIDDAYILYDEGAGIPADMTAAALTTYMKSKATPDYTDIKAAITFGTPVIFGSFIPASFFAARSSFWEPTYDEKQNPGQAVLSNEGMHQMHAMTIIGYDDNKYGGAFEVMNSWGEAFGNKGFMWVKYADWALFCYEAYALELGGLGDAEMNNVSGCVSGDCDNGYGIYKFASGDRYEGHFSGRNFNGYGIYTWASGEVYAGQWSMNKRQGEGTRYLPNGEYGTCIYDNDKLISGFSNWSYTNGDTYYGALAQDFSRIGFGRYTFSNGSVYEGSWKNNVREGLGRMTYTNGDIYVGEWSDDSPNGVGMLIHTNGKVDAGSWSYGKMMSGQSYGYATDQSLLAVRELSLPEPSALAYASADCTDGDCLYGKGKRVYKGGATYEGEFKDGVEDGFGTMTYGDGTKVKSNWKQGYNFGVARYDYGDGTMALAEFKGGTLNGYVLVMKSGNMVVQYYEDGVYLRQVNPTYSPGTSVMNGDLSNNAPSSGSSIEVPGK